MPGVPFLCREGAPRIRGGSRVLVGGGVAVPSQEALRCRWKWRWKAGRCLQGVEERERDQNRGDSPAMHLRSPSFVLCWPRYRVACAPRWSGPSPPPRSSGLSCARPAGLTALALRTGWDCRPWRALSALALGLAARSSSPLFFLGWLAGRLAPRSPGPVVAWCPARCG